MPHNSIRVTAAFLALCCVFGQVSAHDLMPPGEVVSIPEESARTWALPAMDAGRGRVLLGWDARIDARRAGGFREFMQVSIDGQPIGARADRLTVRLANKPDRFFRDDG